MEYARLVRWDFDVLDQSWVGPDGQAVVRKARGGHKLLVGSAPTEGGNLAASVNAVGTGTRGGVPEVDHAVVGTAAGGEQVRLPWAPGKSLDGGLVVGLLELWCVEGTGVPDGDEVVVATGSQLSAIGTPLETADLGGVGDELSDLVLGDTDIVVVDEARAGTGGEQVLVPAHDADTGVMAVHGSELGTLLNVPDLDLTRTETCSNIGAVTAPLDRGDVSVLWALEEAGHGARLCRPDVDVTLEANGNLVAR